MSWIWSTSGSNMLVRCVSPIDQHHGRSLCLYVSGGASCDSSWSQQVLSQSLLLLEVVHGQERAFEDLGLSGWGVGVEDWSKSKNSSGEKHQSLDSYATLMKKALGPPEQNTPRSVHLYGICRFSGCEHPIILPSKPKLILDARSPDRSVRSLRS